MIILIACIILYTSGKIAKGIYMDQTSEDCNDMNKKQTALFFTIHNVYCEHMLHTRHMKLCPIIYYIIYMNPV